MGFFNLPTANLVYPIDEASYQRKLKALRDERSILADQISRVQSNFLDGFQLASNSILELANSAKSLWKMKSNEERIKILKMVLSNQTLKGKTVEFALKRPYVALTKICDLKRLKKNLISDDEVLKNWCPRAGVQSILTNLNDSSKLE